MPKAASEAEMLDAAIVAIVRAALLAVNDTNPVPGPRGLGLEELEGAYGFSRDLLSPAQWDDPTFVTLADVVDAACPAIQCRRVGIDRSDADTELAEAVERAQDFVARRRSTLN